VTSTCPCCQFDILVDSIIAVNINSTPEKKYHCHHQCIKKPIVLNNLIVKCMKCLDDIFPHQKKLPTSVCGATGFMHENCPTFSDPESFKRVFTSIEDTNTSSQLTTTTFSSETQVIAPDLSPVEKHFVTANYNIASNNTSHNYDHFPQPKTITYDESPNIKNETPQSPADSYHSGTTTNSSSSGLRHRVKNVAAEFVAIPATCAVVADNTVNTAVHSSSSSSYSLYCGSSSSRPTRAKKIKTESD
jgi:hypothetical protein